MKTKRTTKTKKSSIPPPPMIRLRLPSEKPTREDADGDGFILAVKADGRFRYLRYDVALPEYVTAWLQGRLPEGLLPKPLTQEQLWRKEFEEWAANGDFDLGKGAVKDAAWEGFLAAKKGGQP